MFRLENLPRQLQFLLGRESFVELFNVRILHIISLRRLVYTGDAVKISMNQFLAEEERVIRAFRKVVVANAKLTGIGKAALAVETDITLKQNSAIAESCQERLLPAPAKAASGYQGRKQWLGPRPVRT